jgi:hypothetical protein
LITAILTGAVQVTVTEFGGRSAIWVWIGKRGGTEKELLLIWKGIARCKYKQMRCRGESVRASPSYNTRRKSLGSQKVAVGKLCHIARFCRLGLD